VPAWIDCRVRAICGWLGGFADDVEEELVDAGVVG
jgi:hypothetical protein